MAESADSPNVFFRNCNKPTVSPVNGSVKGNIPTWLTGTLIRNGPGIRKVGSQTYRHMFDGLALLHRFHIENGQVTYSNHPLESEAYKNTMVAQRIVSGGFGTNPTSVPDPCDSLFNKFKSTFVSKNVDLGDLDDCSVNVAYYGDQLYAMTETTCVRQIDPVTLKCVGDKTNIGDYIAINLVSAHPHILPDGTALNLGINHRHKKGACYLITQVPPTFGSKDTNFKDVKILAEIPSRWRFYPGYYHSFGMTKDKIIFIEQPYCFRIPRFLAGTIIPFLGQVSFADAHHWYPNEKTRIHVVSMTNGEIHPIIYETDNLFTFHHANAYEEDGHVVVDLSGSDDAEYVNKDIVEDGIRKNSSVRTGAQARRYVLPLDVAAAKKGENLVTLKDSKASATLRKNGGNIVDLKHEVLQDEWMEFPRINYRMNGLKYRYIYGCNSSFSKRADSPFPEPDILVKLDCKGGEPLTWVGKGVWTSEPVFVQDPTIENPAEDDGVILSSLLYKDNQLKTALLILDAKTMTELATIEFSTEGPITATFHGQWATSGEQIHHY